MKVRLYKVLVAVSLMLPLTGCPAETTLVLGLWLFSIEETPGFTGVAFLPNGEMDEFDPMNKPPGAIGVFAGELTWEQVGDSVTVSQNNNGSGRIYSGTLVNTTYMTGTWVDVNNANDTGAFVASKAPSD